MVEIRPMTPSDWPAVEAIYAAGIATRQATFETETPSWAEFDATRHAEPRLVAVQEGQVVGWAALSPASRRSCYAGVAEHSVYVRPDARGKGVGRTLLDALVERSRREGFWTLQTSVFPENSATVALHEKLGFRVVGRRERIAQLDGAWRDTLLLELRL